MLTLCIASAKGGSGKSTLATTLATIYAGSMRTVLYDCDPQASATLALGQGVVADPWNAEPVRIDVPGGLHLYRGGRSIAPRSSDLPRPGWSADLRVLDTPPALEGLTPVAIEQADLVIVPLEPSPLHLPALADIEAMVRGLPRPPLLRAVLMRVQPRLLLTRQVIAHLEHAYPGLLYDARIPQDVRVAEAPGFGTSVVRHAPRSRAAAAYRALAREVRLDLTRAAGRPE